MKIKILLFLIIILAAFLRFDGIRYIEFKEDEALYCFLASDLVYKGIFPLVSNMLSVGIYNPAIPIYLIAPPFLFSKNPVVISSYIVLLNLLAIFLCFLFCKEFFNINVAIVSSCFFSVNPWVILYSRKIWPNDMLPLFVVLFFYSLYKVTIKKEDKYILLSLLFLCIVTQLHPSTFFYLALLSIVIMISKPKIKPLYYIIGIGIFILLYLPYFMFEFTNNFYDLKAFLNLIKFPFNIEKEAISIPFILATTKYFICSSRIHILDKVQLFFLIAGIIYLFWYISDAKYRILLLWFFIPILFFLFWKFSLSGLYHYFIPLYPVQFIIIGVFVDWIYQIFKKNLSILKFSPLIIVTILMFYQLKCSLSFNSYIKTHSHISWIGYGQPFQYKVEEIKKFMKFGFFDPETIYQQIVSHKPEELRFKYDFLATKYIVENIKSIPDNYVAKIR